MSEIHDKMADYVTEKAKPKSVGFCARFVVNGMVNAGLSVERQDAYRYYTSNLLEKAGFKKIARGTTLNEANKISFQKGDVIAFDKSPEHKYGHIQMFNGKQWVSDFKQNRFTPYKDTLPWILWRY